MSARAALGFALGGAWEGVTIRQQGLQTLMGPKHGPAVLHRHFSLMRPQVRLGQHGHTHRCLRELRGSLTL